MADVFISYKREEREDVVRIADALRALKLDVWFDARLTSGESFNQEIDREARSAGCILVCWSPGAIASDWVQAESLIGFNDRKLAACQVAGDHALQVPAPFNAIHANDLRDWSGEGDHSGWQALLQRIGEKLDRPGLTDFAQATGVEPAKKRITALEKFAQKYASDPLAELAWNEIERLELDEAQSRIAARKAEAAKKAAEEAARRKPAAADPREETLDRDAEQARAWALMGENASPAQLREFVRNWQAGPFVDLARERLARLDDDSPKKRKAGAVMVPLIALMALAGLGIGGALIDPFGWFESSPDDEAREFTPVQAGGTHASTLESGAPTPAHPDEGRDLGQEAEGPGLRRDERKFKVGSSFTDCTGCPEMVVLPSGSFTMGSPSSEPDRDDDEGPQRTVRIGYKLAVGKYEVTWSQWEACVSAGACSNSGPDGRGGDEGFGKGSRPVINVSWNDAHAYVKWLSRKTGHTYRLLSEAEWEYAARAGTTTPFSFGSTISTRQANYNGNYTYNGGSKGEHRQKTVSVGSFPANAWGLHDMHGNVWEWVEDWYKSGCAVRRQRVHELFQLLDVSGAVPGMPIATGSQPGRQYRRLADHPFSL